MGGYLPLELCRGKEYHQFEQDKMVRVNCGRAAIYAALIQFHPKRVVLPYFICPTVKALVKKMNIPYVEYSITEDFSPVKLQFNKDDCIILVNYFGLINREKIALELAGETHIILDNTQAFYAKPIFHPNILNVYSCRKFFGVSDGGYLIGEHIEPIDFQPATSWKDSVFLAKSLELGTNAAYALKKECEERMGTVYTQMSLLTKSIMDGIDYSDIAEKRRANFEVLNRLLGNTNALEWGLENNTPYSYPFMIKKNIRNYLLENKVYVPIIWKENIDMKKSTTVESDFSKWIYHLPIDQRYDQNDMKYLSKIILKRV